MSENKKILTLVVLLLLIGGVNFECISCILDWEWANKSDVMMVGLCFGALDYFLINMWLDALLREDV